MRSCIVCVCVCVRYVCVLITLYLRFNGYLRGPVYSSSKIVDNFSIETETNNTAPKPEFYDRSPSFEGG